MKKKIISLALSVFAGLGLFLVVVVAPQPVSAAWSDCPVNGNVACAWSGTNASGTRYSFPYSVYGSGACWNLTDPTSTGPGSGNNRWSSVLLRFTYAYNGIIGWDYKGCNNTAGNPGLTFIDDTQYHLESYLSGTWNDRVSSFYVYSSN